MTATLPQPANPPASPLPSTPRALPLAGVRVVEFTHMVMGVRGLCAGMLTTQAPWALKV